MEDSTEKTFSLQEFQVGGVIIRAVEEVGLWEWLPAVEKKAV